MTLRTLAVAVVLSARSAALVFAEPAIVAPAATQQIASPDAHLQVTVTVADDVRYALALDGAPLVLPSPVSLSLAMGACSAVTPGSSGWTGARSPRRSRRRSASDGR